jgi:hypothetical protein
MDHPFESDGCSLVADFGTTAICVEHDWAYWLGDAGPQTRAEADRHFRDQLLALGGYWRLGGWIRWLGVRIGGVGWIPAPKWRWGYGWKYPSTGKGHFVTEGPYTAMGEWPKFEAFLALARGV